MILNNKYAYSSLRVAAWIYLYVFMEWLFFATKPSFLSVYPWLDRVLAFFISTLPFLITALLLHACACVIARLLARFRRMKGMSDAFLRAVPALIIGLLTIILLDNFTYTMFHWGIVKTNVYTIPMYWVLFLGCFLFVIRRKIKYSRVFSLGTISLIAISALIFMGAAFAYKISHASIVVKRSNSQQPNIIMFASDGVNADHLSAYGYKRDTTPNLDKWLKLALVADNAFTNSGMTAGSMTAMMTSKYPATTKLFYPPQILHGRDAYQQLPEILRQLGYEGLQETVSPYADAMGLNWQDSFSYANGRKLHWSETRFTGPMQTASQITHRVRNRLQVRTEQLLFVKKMADEYAAVTSETVPAGRFQSDWERMQAVYDFIRHAKRPFFIHVHLMGTHLNGSRCCLWHGKDVFKVEPNATIAEQNSNALDNAIFQSDKYFGQMMALLGQQSLLDNTIIVYTSDHATGWDFRSRVPMILIFPRAAATGHLAAPTQLMDVAPTLLDFMGFSIPQWMEGRSILDGGLSKYYPIFVGYHAIYWDPSTPSANMGPPLYNLAQDGLVVCNRWYVLTLADHVMATGKIADFKGSCDDRKVPSVERAKALMTQHLRERGFEF